MTTTLAATSQCKPGQRQPVTGLCLPGVHRSRDQSLVHLTSFPHLRLGIRETELNCHYANCLPLVPLGEPHALPVSSFWVYKPVPLLTQRGATQHDHVCSVFFRRGSGKQATEPYHPRYD